MVLILSLFSLPSSLLAVPSPAASLIEAADAAWAEREQEGRTLAAIALYQQALLADPERKDVWIALTRSMGRAVRRSSTLKERREWAKRARDAGKQATLENPKSSMAHAYYAEALGQYAQAHKGLGSLKLVKEAVRQLNKALQLDPSNAYAHMLLASIYREAPGVLSVGDKAKALDHAQTAVKLAPQWAITRLTLAKVLRDYGRVDDAAAELRTILTLTPPPDVIPETRADQGTARQMLINMGVSKPTPCETDPGTCRDEK